MSAIGHTLSANVTEKARKTRLKWSEYDFIATSSRIVCFNFFVSNFDNTLSLSALIVDNSSFFVH